MANTIGGDVALAGTATVTADSFSYQGAPPDSRGFAIDGDTSGAHPSIYHSATKTASEFLTITFDQAYDITSLFIYGRDSFGERDVWDIILRDGNNDIVASLFDQSANNAGHVASIDVTAVPLPAAAWLFISALAGMCFVGRRRQTLALVATWRARLQLFSCKRCLSCT